MLSTQTGRPSRRFRVASAALAVVAIAFLAFLVVRPLDRSHVTQVKSEYTGTFGGTCTPTSHQVCICNDGKSVCVEGESLVNGLKAATQLPPVGTKVHVTVKQLTRHDITQPTVVAITPSG